jgi:AraC-like DNA-binding protein
LAIEEDSVLLLHRILRDPRERSSATPGRPAGSIRTLRDLVDAARLELLAAPGETHSLTPLAHKLGMSPFHLARRFRRELGLPVHQYLLRLRLALALDRIRDGATGFSRLAWELGFSSHSHFSATFRTTYGMTPTEAAQGLAPGNDR